MCLGHLRFILFLTGKNIEEAPMVEFYKELNTSKVIGVEYFFHLGHRTLRYVIYGH
jgi:hypothetical protein